MPEIPGGHAGALFEQLAEIVLIAVSHFKGNVAGAHLGGFQQSFCLVDAQQGLLPGVYTVEATAQTADILLLSLDRYRGKTPLFLGIDRVTFLQKIMPGDTIEIRASIVKERREKAIATCAAEVFCRDKLAAKTEVTLAMR